MEKTFDELIEESPLNDLLSVPEIDLVKELLQQVREATIAECIDKISELHGSIYKGAYEEYLATNLPTDRIKIDEKA